MTLYRNPEAYDRFQKTVEWPMIVLSIAFVPIVLIPLLWDVSPQTNSALETGAWIIWAAFAGEYLTLLFLAPNKANMFRTHLFDLIIIVLPLLRPLRAARVLRLLRAVSGLARATHGLRLF